MLSYWDLLFFFMLFPFFTSFENELCSYTIIFSQCHNYFNEFCSEPTTFLYISLIRAINSSSFDFLPILATKSVLFCGIYSFYWASLLSYISISLFYFFIPPNDLFINLPTESLLFLIFPSPLLWRSNFSN